MASLLSKIGFSVETKTGGHMMAMMTCVGKVAFATPQLAMAVVRRHSKKRNRELASRQAYKCGRCGMFHIGRGSQP